MDKAKTRSRPQAQQNQEMLSRMDQCAAQQLKLQQMVEGLSVVALTYYAASLASYLLQPLADSLEIDKTTLTATITLPTIAAV